MIKIVKSFTGYPDGVKRSFAVGDEPEDLTAEYCAQLVEKKLAEKTTPKKAKRNEAE